MANETNTVATLTADDSDLWRHRDETKPDPAFAYSRRSILVHWITVAVVILLILTSGGLHMLLGIVFALPLLVRFWWRWSRGFPRVPDESVALAAFERLAIICNLIALLILTLTGLGTALFSASPIFGALGIWLSGLETAPAILENARYVHNGAALTFYASILVHLLSAVRHWRYRSTGIFVRIMRAQDGGS